MKVTIKLEDGRRVPAKPTAAGHWVETTIECAATPGHYLDARSDERRRVGHDRYEGAAYCMACGKHVGIICVQTSTIFGTEEDEAVLEHGRARVY